MLTELLILLTPLFTHRVEPIWAFACQNVSEYKMFVLGCFVSQITGYFLGCLPFTLLDVFKATSKPLKIQQKVYPTNTDLWKTTKALLLSFCTVVLPLLSVGGFFINAVGITRHGPFPDWQVVLVQVFFFFLVEDFFNYWIHRWLHRPWWYKNIHSVHHTYNAPFSIVAAYAHPVEVLLQAIPTFLGPLAIGPHLYTLMVWQTFRNWEAIDIHSGYEFRFGLKKLFPHYAGAAHHDYHHYMHSGNFASVFTWCDELYGTNLGYESFCAKNDARGTEDHTQTEAS